MSAPARGFLSHFLLLAVISGSTLGMAKIVTTLYALEIGANSVQIGLISAMESLGMVFLTLPAGFLIARFGSRRIYLLASLGPALFNLAILLSPGWLWLAAMRLLIGTCVPFRVVAMNTLFLQQLPHIGLNKAGWFRGSVMIGLGLLGPWLGSVLYGQAGFAGAFVVIALCFTGMAFYGAGFWQEAPAAPSRSSLGQQLRDMFSQRSLTESCLIECASSATMSVFATFALVLCIEVLGWPDYQAVALVSAQGLVSVLALFGLGSVISHLGHQRVYPGALLLVLVALGLLGWADSFPGLLLAALLLSLAGSAIHLANVTRLSHLLPDKSRISGLFNLAQTLGMLLGALLGGSISYLVGLHWLFPVWGLLLLTGVGLLRLKAACRVVATAEEA
ncbi:MFS transporter [Pseudomonas sp. MM211]|uniref:MFS transporter n=1 Tax=Pseudomonas sp. MM211 TaxID=2866808 RepID=UPI001CECBB3D|nr:MFS transporter [Pseudomonas sp. MM211]UCJ16695.1 MFS transporter [Pseudomonas sp. MM211]